MIDNNNVTTVNCFNMPRGFMYYVILTSLLDDKTEYTYCFRMPLFMKMNKI